MELVNDAFWLKFAKDKIESGFDSVNTAAENLGKQIAIFWGIYTLLFTTGATLLKLQAPAPVIWLLALPIPLLIGAYCFTLWAQHPMISKKVDPRRPKQVELFYAATIRAKKSRLTIAALITVASGISLAIALIVSNVYPSPPANHMNAAFDQTNEKGNVIVSGQLPEGSIVSIDVRTAIVETDSLPGSVTNLPTYQSIVGPTNDFQYTYTVLPWPDSIKVVINWKEKAGAATQHSLIKIYPEN